MGIGDWLMQYEAEIGEENLVFFLSGFSCPKNLEVEDFLKSKARQSSRLISIILHSKSNIDLKTSI